MNDHGPDPPPLPPAQERRDAILGAVAWSAERFLRGRWEEELPRVLERLGRAAGVSRAYLFRNTENRDGAVCQDLTHEWCAPGIPSTMDDPENHDLPYLPEYPHYVEELGSGRVMVMTQSDARPVDLEDLREEGILSGAFVPVFLRKEWWGYLGLDDCEQERAWMPSELDALRAAAAILGAAVVREEADRTAAEVEARYRTLVEQIPAVTYIDGVTDPPTPPHDTLFISPQIEQVTGYTADEFLADAGLWERIAYPDDRDSLRGAERGEFTDGTHYEAEYRLVARDGRVVWIHDEAQMLPGQFGYHKIWLGVIYDATAFKIAVEQEREVADRLRSLDELKDTFLNAVSHDLRTPVSAILGLALTLARDTGGLTEDEKQDFAARIARNAGKLQRLIQDLLDVDRLTRGVLGLELRDTNVERIALRVLEETELELTHPVTVDLAPTLAAVDEGKVERILENLLLNAGRHTPEGTPIRVLVHPDGEGGALIQVDDGGDGVPPELRDAIFEPFRQAGGDVASPGVGIGLSLVAKFAELHGGRAWIEDAEGGGASFRVSLPAPGRA